MKNILLRIFQSLLLAAMEYVLSVSRLCKIRTMGILKICSALIVLLILFDFVSPLCYRNEKNSTINIGGKEEGKEEL